jgi:hypothetical protein
MKPFRAAVLGCALAILGGEASTANAAWDGVFQATFFHCHKKQACYSPAVTYYPPCGPPMTCYTVQPRCGPIRRLFGKCRPVTVCTPACPCPAPRCCPPPCPAPCPVQAVPPPQPPSVVDPCPPVSRYSLPPPPAARIPPPDVRVEPNYGPNPAEQPLPRPDMPPVSGSNYRPVRPLAPVPPQQLTPPLPPAGVRLERIASRPVTKNKVQGKLVSGKNSTRDTAQTIASARTK